MRFTYAALLFVAFSSIHATEPGSPLEWTVDSQGVGTTYEMPFPCGDVYAPHPACSIGSPAVVDNRGRLVYVRTETIGVAVPCGLPSYTYLKRHTLVALADGVEVPIGHVEDNCGDSVTPLGLTFDAMNGKVRVALHHVAWNGDPLGNELLGFDGFPKLTDVLPRRFPPFPRVDMTKAP